MSAYEEYSDSDESNTNSTDSAEHGPIRSKELSMVISHIENDDVDGVSEWCEQWDNIPMYIQQRIMYVAVKRGSVDILETLVQHGFNPKRLETKEEDEIPLVPILEAASAGHFDVVKKLVEEYDVHVDERHPSTNTALMIAVLHLNLRLVKYLLTKGADPNSIYHAPSGRLSPLYIAVLISSTECACLLLDAGADVSIPVSFVGSLINRAVGSGSLGMTKLLHERGAKLDIVGDNGEGIVHLALVPRPHINIIRYLVENDAPLEAVSNKGYSPLGHAMKETRSCEEILEWLPILLDTGYQPTHQDYNAMRENFRFKEDDFKKIMDMVEKYVSSPRTLLYLCRNRIRRLLGIRLSEKIQCLPLPSALKQYLDYQ